MVMKSNKVLDIWSPVPGHFFFFFRDTRSFANLLKSSLGSGILAMPAAFKNSGTVVGVFGTIILGYICTHCVFLLVKLQHYFGYADSIGRSHHLYSTFIHIITHMALHLLAIWNILAVERCLIESYCNLIVNPSITYPLSLITHRIMLSM